MRRRMLAAAVIALAQLTVAPDARAQCTVASTPIASRAVTTLNVPGYADFLAPDGRSVWATNEGRIEQLHPDSARPSSVPGWPTCAAS